MADKYFPDAKEPHLHIHKNGITFTDDGHRHKDLANNQAFYKPACESVINDLKVGNDREKKIAEEIKRLLRANAGKPPKVV